MSEIMQFFEAAFKDIRYSLFCVFKPGNAMGLGVKNARVESRCSRTRKPWR